MSPGHRLKLQAIAELRIKRKPLRSFPRFLSARRALKSGSLYISSTSSGCPPPGTGTRSPYLPFLGMRMLVIIYIFSVNGPCKIPPPPTRGTCVFQARLKGFRPLSTAPYPERTYLPRSGYLWNFCKVSRA